MNFSVKNTGAACHFLLWGIFPGSANSCGVNSYGRWEKMCSNTVVQSLNFKGVDDTDMSHILRSAEF